MSYEISEKLTQVQELLEKAVPSDWWKAAYQKVFKTPETAPCFKWSLGNFVLMQGYRTADARTFNQWKEIGRSVNKGAKAVYILAPCMKSFEKEREDGEKEKVSILSGFKLLPVFRYEDTNGEALEDEKLIKQLSSYQLANLLNLNVEYGPTMNGERGYFIPGTNKIHMSIDSAQTLAHEISHYLDSLLNPEEAGILDDQDERKCLREMVAEGSAYALAELLGYTPEEEKSAGYLQSWGKKDGKELLKKSLPRIEKILKYVSTLVETEKKEAA